jgi:hypothetical protein
MEAPQDNTATATDGGAPSSEAATAEHEMLPVTRATRSSKRPRGGDAAAVAEPEEKKSRQPAEADPPEEPKGPKGRETDGSTVNFVYSRLCHAILWLAVTLDADPVPSPLTPRCLFDMTDSQRVRGRLCGVCGQFNVALTG